MVLTSDTLNVRHAILSLDPKRVKVSIRGPQEDCAAWRGRMPSPCALSRISHCLAFISVTFCILRVHSSDEKISACAGGPG
ncbi:hypothetical protein BDR03DRAFT_941804 [Suillus americanus]|nr:hypothetical protein BDR03DRAFT_941804 [Suillus americanus]